MTNEQIARAWAQYNGQRGTDKQVATILRTMDVETITRMLIERGVLKVA